MGIAAIGLLSTLSAAASAAATVPAAAAPAAPVAAAPATAASTLNQLHSLDHWLAMGELYGLRLLGAIVIILVGLWLAKRLSRALDAVLERTQTEATLRGFLRNIAYGAMVVVIILAALQFVGFAPASLFAVLGAAGLGIGLALKDSLSNLVAGLQLIVQRPFRAGDYVVAANLEGTVEQVRVFQTRLRTPDNRVLILPNSLIIAAAITNFTAVMKRRIDVATSVGHAEDLQAARTRLVEIARAHPKVMREPEPAVVATALGADNRISLELRAWVRTGDVQTARSELTEAVRNGMIELGIGTPAVAREIRILHQGAGELPMDQLLAAPAAAPGAGAPTAEDVGKPQTR
ncbi:mechanosensitive ion channel family protein [Agrilutibacter solisilvae]|uniref:Small-conductance mechanosensitive channel n=1 Tax=Agrilutibacter solisilvae TaxID=2763317 RepID=A0A975AS86_9GAMM|nr:mechanosensitive ion channel [Lysobacter solisilvae]QSX77710.1 mechanosensitive ion channel [Lysobacter solisilvae]